MLCVHQLSSRKMSREHAHGHVSSRQLRLAISETVYYGRSSNQKKLKWQRFLMRWWGSIIWGEDAWFTFQVGGCRPAQDSIMLLRTVHNCKLKTGLFLELPILVFSLSSWPQVNKQWKGKLVVWSSWIHGHSYSWSPNYLIFISENRIIWLADSFYQTDGLKHGDPIFRDEPLKT